MHLFAITANLRFQDVLDILFLTMMVYYLYRWFRGTKAFKALVGLVALGLVYTVADAWGLFLTTWVFQLLWQVLVILLIILFQSEIRQVLERVNPLKRMGWRKGGASEKWIQPFARVIFEMAKKRIGVLIIIERTDLVDELVTAGQVMDAQATPELLASIFQKGAPLHDGAVVVKAGRIARVACYLPLSSSEGLPKGWGTRHRAALGLSERSDAWVVVVSEENGQVALARNGKLEAVQEPRRLNVLILEAEKPLSPPKTKWSERIVSWLTHQWHIKAASFMLVCVFWLLLAGQQNFEVSLKIPLETVRMPQQLEIVAPVDPQVKVTIRGLRKDASTLRTENVRALLDLSMARSGNWVFRITRDDIVLTNQGLSVVDIKPAEFTFELRERK